MTSWAAPRVFGQASRFRLLQTLVVFLAICDTIRRMVVEGTRPIDLWMLVIELLVLLLIAYEVGIGIFRSSKDKKRAQQVQARSEKIRQVITKGQELQREAPRFGTTGTLAAKWMTEETSWYQTTKTLLESYSAQAGVAFLHDTSGEVPPWWDSISVSARNQYSTLISSLNNLRHILERPDVYL